MNVPLARTTHVAGGVYKVGVGVSLIGRMRWTAAAREGREERDSISLPTSECPYPSCGSHATARARTHARSSHSHAPPPPLPHNPPHSHAVVFCLHRGELPSFLSAPAEECTSSSFGLFRVRVCSIIVSVDERWSVWDHNNSVEMISK